MEIEHFLQQLPVAAGWFDSGLRLRHVNVLLEERLGKTRGELVGRSWESLAGLPGFARLGKPLRRALGRPEDVQEIFTDVCGHRLVLDPKARINRVTAEHVLRQILQETEAPGVE